MDIVDPWCVLIEILLFLFRFRFRCASLPPQGTGLRPFLTVFPSPLCSITAMILASRLRLSPSLLSQALDHHVLACLLTTADTMPRARWTYSASQLARPSLQMTLVQSHVTAQGRGSTYPTRLAIVESFHLVTCVCAGHWGLFRL